MIVGLRPFEGPRLRVRWVDEEAFAAEVGRQAREQNSWLLRVTHGGDVANNYGWPAETECVLAFSNPLGVAIYWCGRTSANKVTDRGAAEACLPGTGDYFDGRVKSPVRHQAAWNLAMKAFRAEVNAMEVIAWAYAEAV